MDNVKDKNTMKVTCLLPGFLANKYYPYGHFPQMETMV